MKTSTLIWDLDGTLLETFGLGVEPFENAARETLGIEIRLNRKKFSGYTDIEILETMMGRPLSISDVRRFEDSYFSAYQAKLYKSKVTAIVSARNVLENTKSESWVKHFIGTGNLVSCGKLKLQSSELLEYFSESHFFGCTYETPNRHSIVRRAIDAACKKGYKNLIVVGDTPKDISTAKLLGLPIIAVSTGNYSYDELYALNPNIVMASNYLVDDFLSALEVLHKQPK